MIALGKRHFFSFCGSHLEETIYPVAHLQTSKWREVTCAYRSSLGFFQNGCLWHTAVPARGAATPNLRNTGTNASAMVHFLLTLIFSVGNLLHKVTVQVSGAYAGGLKIKNWRHSPNIFQVSFGRHRQKSWWSRWVPGVLQCKGTTPLMSSHTPGSVDSASGLRRAGAGQPPAEKQTGPAEQSAVEQEGKADIQMPVLWKSYPELHIWILHLLGVCQQPASKLTQLPWLEQAEHGSMSASLG